MATEKTILQHGFEGQAKAMREFGYPEVTAEMIAEHHAAWLKTGSAGEGVVARFSEAAFADYPKIFGVREGVSHADR